MINNSNVLTKTNHCVNRQISYFLIYFCVLTLGTQLLWQRESLCLLFSKLTSMTELLVDSDSVLRLRSICDFTGELMFSTHEDDIYQSLIVNTASFIVTTCSAEMYPTVEDQLIKQLLQPKLCSAVFSSDILCLVAR